MLTQQHCWLQLKAQTAQLVGQVQVTLLRSQHQHQPNRCCNCCKNKNPGIKTPGFFVGVNIYMMVNKITEIKIFESPDGGRTVYARQPGSTDRELYSQDSALQQELKDLENSKRWVEILQARRDNPELDHLCEQVEILYELGRKSK